MLISIQSSGCSSNSTYHTAIETSDSDPPGDSEVAGGRKSAQEDLGTKSHMMFLLREKVNPRLIVVKTFNLWNIKTLLESIGMRGVQTLMT
jgi:hypothetical protein